KHIGQVGLKDEPESRCELLLTVKYEALAPDFVAFSVLVELREPWRSLDARKDADLVVTTWRDSVLYATKQGDLPWQLREAIENEARTFAEEVRAAQDFPGPKLPKSSPAGRRCAAPSAER